MALTESSEPVVSLPPKTEAAPSPQKPGGIRSRQIEKAWQSRPPDDKPVALSVGDQQTAPGADKHATFSLTSAPADEEDELPEELRELDVATDEEIHRMSEDRRLLEEKDQRRKQFVYRSARGGGKKAVKKPHDNGGPNGVWTNGRATQAKQSANRAWAQAKKTGELGSFHDMRVPATNSAWAAEQLRQKQKPGSIGTANDGQNRYHPPTIIPAPRGLPGSGKSESTRNPQTVHERRVMADTKQQKHFGQNRFGS